jgi:cyclopropane fatty-acyl-phospholipid synthase-like methyltransferase
MTYFDTAYEGTPTWDVGRPQGAVVRLAESGAIEGSVIDVGCGTGENALYLASLGCEVVGVDFASAAIEKAMAKARERALGAQFLVWDALKLAELGRSFDTAIDVGMFHTLQPEQRAEYAASLRAAIRPGGRAYLLCWSARNPFGYGPERIRKLDIRGTFRGGWSVEEIAAETLDSLMAVGTVHAWLARLRRK